MQNFISTILVAVDFTEKSRNAAVMAVNIALRHKARIILFHNITNHTIIDRTGKQVIGAETIDENYKKTEFALNELEASIKSQYPDLKLQTVIKNDSLVHAINDTVHEETVDLVVCGSSGQQNFTRLFLGSLSYEILTEANSSVLLVPEKCRKYAFDKILVPVRVLEDLADKIDLSIAIAKKNKGVISLLGISNEDDLLKIKDAYQTARTSIAIKAQDYDSQFLMTRNKATQISKFSHEDDADIIILNYKDEDSWKSFFLENFFKQIINNTDIPLFFLKSKRMINKEKTDDNMGIDITLPSPG